MFCFCFRLQNVTILTQEEATITNTLSHERNLGFESELSFFFSYIRLTTSCFLKDSSDSMKLLFKLDLQTSLLPPHIHVGPQQLQQAVHT